MKPRFDGTVALVVGASRGIGAGTARAWAKEGAAVVLAARDQSALDTLAADISAAGGRALVVRTDVTDASAMRELVARAVAEFGRLDFAFNNVTAGPMPSPLTEIEVDGFDEGIAANVRGTFLGMKYQIPALLASGGGAIVNMASLAGVQGVANLGAYVAGKAGIIGLSKVAALDYADQGVRVNVVAPGPILTHHLRRAGEYAQEMAARSTPMHRIGTVDDVANAVLWLCSAEAAFITGITLPIDGGQSAGHKPAQMYRRGQSMDPEPIIEQVQ
jgi:NAD(P)-dependent dehydrogenase (short-subunit alcohol dehydrogenase family)